LMRLVTFATSCSKLSRCYYWCILVGGGDRLVVIVLATSFVSPVSSSGCLTRSIVALAS
jgi:hypothetical protein